VAKKQPPLTVSQLLDYYALTERKKAELYESIREEVEAIEADQAEVKAGIEELTRRIHDETGAKTLYGEDGYQARMTTTTTYTYDLATIAGALEEIGIDYSEYEKRELDKDLLRKNHPDLAGIIPNVRKSFSIRKPEEEAK
jgi:hypothetical protein